MNKIIEIKTIFDAKNLNKNLYYDGYSIKTEKDTYYFLIECDQCCCERWGYITSDENLNDYVGKELIDIEIVDTACNKISNILKEECVEECECIFINLKFENLDMLQFAVYNSHNGYYGHNVLFLKNEEVIINCEL